MNQMHVLPTPRVAGVDLLTGRVHGVPPGGVRALPPIQRSAMARLQAWASTLKEAERWAWVDVALTYDLQVWRAYVRAPVRTKAASPAMAEALDALRLQHECSEQSLDEAYCLRHQAASRALRAAQKARISALEAQCMHHAALVEEMREQCEVSAAELADRVGALVTFDRHGWVRIKRHLLRT